MTARILSIGTAVPDTRIHQDRVRDFFAAQPERDRLAQRLIHAAFDAAAIDTRHTALTQLADDETSDARIADAAALDVVGAGRRLLAPTTGERNDFYRLAAPPLSADAARAALSDAGVPASAVTHVITVSCTGFFAPGPDYLLVRDLGLSASTRRCHVGFMGCAAALPALRLAATITAAEPSAVVLVVCAELCTLHIRGSSDPEQIVASSVFADGAAAAVVTAAPEWADAGGLDLDRFGTTLTEDGEEDMVWTIGDHGFEMTLTAEVPRIIGREIRAAVTGFLGGTDPDAWAVHPGGRSVLDRVEAGLDLEGDALVASRQVLRRFGNMSSATVLFILRDLLAEETLPDGARVAALAFGPGLTVEAALCTKRAAAPA